MFSRPIYAAAERASSSARRPFRSVVTRPVRFPTPRSPVRLRPIVAPRLYERVAREIARLIDEGTFAAGSRLPAERELAKSLGV